MYESTDGAENTSHLYFLDFITFMVQWMFAASLVIVGFVARFFGASHEHLSALRITLGNSLLAIGLAVYFICFIIRRLITKALDESN